MADNILHSGSFCDRNNDEIIITFYEKGYTPRMTVEPTELSYIAAGDTKTLTVSGYTGTLSINIPGAWLSYTSSTSGGVTTYNLTATQNQTTTVRRTTITLTDDNTTIQVEAVQAGTASSIVINPAYMTLAAAGETRTASVSWSGGTTPTFTGKADWVGITTSTSGNTMTVTVTVGENSGDDRSNTITFTNGISSATLSITQNAATVLYVLPDQLSYDAEGGLWMVTVYWTGDVTPTYTINYGSGSGWLVQRGEPVPVASHEVQYTFRAEANTGDIRSASIVFSLGQLSETVTVTQAGTVPATISVDKTEINNVSATGATDIVTVTYNGQGYITPSGYDSWITVTYKDAPTTTTVRYDINIAQNTGAARNTTITWTGSLGGTATTTVSQVAPAVAWTVSPSTINNVGYNGGTYNLTFAGTPSIGMGYELDPVSVDWVTANISSLSAATVTVGANATTSQRTATVKFYKMDDHSTYVTVSITQAGMPVIWSVVPSAITNGLAAGNTYNVSMSGIPSAGMSYDIIYGSGNNWITIASFPNTDFTLTTSANSSTSSRDATVKYIDLSDSSHYITTTVHQYGVEADPLHVYDSSMSFAAAGGNQGTIVENIVGTLSITPPEWITVSTSGSGGTRTVGVHASVNDSTIARSGSVVFDDDRQSPVTMAVSQEGAAAPTPTLSVSPTSITYNPNGGTYGITATWTVTEPTATLTYVEGTPGWLTAIAPSVSGNIKEWAWTASANNTGSSRTARVTVSNGGEPVYVIISQASASFDYYVNWTPYLSSGTFSMDNSTYNFSDYSSNIFTDFSGVVTSQAFMSTLINTLDTNASVIGSLAFAYCDNLTSASLSQCKELSNTVFGECSRLSQVSLPICESIGYGVFQGCSSLESINLPACTKLSNNAFARCTNLSMVSIPLVQTISNRTFVSCSNLESVYAPSCVTVGSEAFLDCVGLISVDLPCNYVYQSAFENCTSLSYVNLPNCYAISERAFMNCTNLVSVSIPVIDYIGNSAFYDCTNLTYIDIYNCSSLGGNVFAGCTNLVSLSSPVLRNVGYRTFYNCVNLETVNLYGGYIGSYAFENCSILSIVTIGGAGRISNYAFYNCPSLSEIRLYSDTGFVSISQNTFSGTMITSSTGSIYVRNALLSVYKSAAYWSIYSSRIYNLGF